MTGRMPAEGINPVDFPNLLADEWGWFLSLNSSRQAGMAVNSISEVEMESYFRNRRITPQAWQLDLIRALDNVALEHSREDK